MNAVLEIRRAAGLTQDELAVRSGVAQPNIAAYETGRRTPSPAMLARLRRAVSPLPHEVLAAKRSDVLGLAEKYHLTNVRLFGSASRGTDTPDSDIDLLVQAPPKTGLMTISSFALDVERLLGVKVDIVTEGGLRADHPIRHEAIAL